MDGDKLIHWLAKEERPACLSYILWLLIFTGPMFPIFKYGSIEHEGIKEPGTFYLCVAISLPFILLCLLSESKKLTVKFSRAYLYSFIIMSILSVIYLAYKMYAYEHHYGYIGYDLVKALLFTPIYMACTAMVFFLIETLLNRVLSRRCHIKQKRES